MKYTSVLIVLLTGLALIISGIAAAAGFESIIPVSLIFALSFFTLVYSMSTVLPSKVGKVTLPIFAFIIAVSFYIGIEVNDLTEDDLAHLMEALTLVGIGFAIFIMAINDLNNEDTQSDTDVSKKA